MKGSVDCVVVHLCALLRPLALLGTQFVLCRGAPLGGAPLRPLLVLGTLGVASVVAWLVRPHERCTNTDPKPSSAVASAPSSFWTLASRVSTRQHLLCILLRGFLCYVTVLALVNAVAQTSLARVVLLYEYSRLILPANIFTRKKRIGEVIQLLKSAPLVCLLLSLLALVVLDFSTLASWDAATLWIWLLVLCCSAMARWSARKPLLDRRPNSTPVFLKSTTALVATAFAAIALLLAKFTHDSYQFPIANASGAASHPPREILVLVVISSVVVLGVVSMPRPSEKPGHFVSLVIAHSIGQPVGNKRILSWFFTAVFSIAGTAISEQSQRLPTAEICVLFSVLMLGAVLRSNDLLTIDGENQPSLAHQFDWQQFTDAILMHKDSRSIITFLALNATMMAIQFFYGYLSNSLGLMSDAVHMLFDCGALVLGLMAAVMAKWPSTSNFPFGYGRMEALAAFVNGLFLIFIGISIIIEATERLLVNPQKIVLSQVLPVSILGFFVNIIGLYFFHEHHHPHHNYNHNHSHKDHQYQHHRHDNETLGTDHGHIHNHKDHNNLGNLYLPEFGLSPLSVDGIGKMSLFAPVFYSGHSETASSPRSDMRVEVHSSHGERGEQGREEPGCCSKNHEARSYQQALSCSHTHENANMKAVFLHILADTLGSFSVIVSALLTHYVGWDGFDPLASVLIAVLISLSTLPLVMSSLLVLLCSAPVHLKNKLPQLQSTVEHMASVVQVRTFIWSHDGNDVWTILQVAYSDESEPKAVRKRRLQAVLCDFGVFGNCIITVRLANRTHK